jgi:glycosyltransferase involved in cell wall biosynthesis
MPKTRVGIFTPDFYPSLGGIGVVALELYRGLLDDAEFEPLVFSPARNDLPKHEHLPAIHTRLLLPITYSVTANALLEHLIRARGLDVLHFMGSSGGAQLLRKPSKPALFTLHNTYHYLYRQHPGLVFRLMREAERRSLRKTTQIVPASYGVRDELPVPDGRNVQVIQNGIDTRLFYPRSVTREPFFLYLGRLGRRKGVFDLLEAFAQSSLPGFELRLAGDGPQEEILEAAARLGIAERVRLLGHVPRAAMPDLFASAHAVVLPSWSEGFPLTVAEAMASGAVFIGSRIPGIIEQVVDRETGFLCPAKDPAALAKCLIEVAHLSPERLSVVRDAAARAAQEHSNDRMIERYRAAYRALLRP